MICFEFVVVQEDKLVGYNITLLGWYLVAYNATLQPQKIYFFGKMYCALNKVY